MPVKLTTHAVERSTFVITVSFTNEDGDPVIPSAATWKLTERDGTVVNSRTAVTISPLAASVDIVLSGADLALSDLRKRYRMVTVEFTYSSALGAGLPGKEQIGFYIDNLGAVS